MKNVEQLEITIKGDGSLADAMEDEKKKFAEESEIRNILIRKRRELSMIDNAIKNPRLSNEKRIELEKRCKKVEDEIIDIEKKLGEIGTDEDLGEVIAGGEVEIPETGEVKDEIAEQALKAGSFEEFIVILEKSKTDDDRDEIENLIDRIKKWKIPSYLHYILEDRIIINYDLEEKVKEWADKRLEERENKPAEEPEETTFVGSLFAKKEGEKMPKDDVTGTEKAELPEEFEGVVGDIEKIKDWEIGSNNIGEIIKAMFSFKEKTREIKKLKQESVEDNKKRRIEDAQFSYGEIKRKLEKERSKLLEELENEVSLEDLGGKVDILVESINGIEIDKITEENVEEIRKTEREFISEKSRIYMIKTISNFLNLEYKDYKEVNEAFKKMNKKEIVEKRKLLMSKIRKIEEQKLAGNGSLEGEIELKINPETEETLGVKEKYEIVIEELEERLNVIRNMDEDEQPEAMEGVRLSVKNFMYDLSYNDKVKEILGEDLINRFGERLKEIERETDGLLKGEVKKAETEVSSKISKKEKIETEKFADKVNRILGEIESFKGVEIDKLNKDRAWKAARNYETIKNEISQKEAEDFYKRLNESYDECERIKSEIKKIEEPAEIKVEPIEKTSEPKVERRKISRSLRESLEGIEDVVENSSRRLKEESKKLRACSFGSWQRNSKDIYSNRGFFKSGRRKKRGGKYCERA